MKSENKCKTCGKVMEKDERWCQFASGQSPCFTNHVKLKLEWCPNPDCKTTVVEIVSEK
jgi:hypothetical protein